MKIIILVLMGLSSLGYADAAKIYEAHCSVCHEQGLAGAPIKKSKDWLVRCQTKGMSGLLASAMQGLNAMPAKGTCQQCQEQDILATIKYMVPDESVCS